MSMCSCLQPKLDKIPIPCQASLAVVQNCESHVITAAKQGYVNLRLEQTQNLTVRVLMDYKFRAIWTTDLHT